MTNFTNYGHFMQKMRENGSFKQEHNIIITFRYQEDGMEIKL